MRLQNKYNKPAEYPADLHHISYVFSGLSGTCKEAVRGVKYI